MSLSIPGLTLGSTSDGGSSLDDSLVARLFAALQPAPVRSAELSYRVKPTKGAAGSEGYQYRNAIRARGVNVKSVAREVSVIRAAVDAAVPSVPIPDFGAITDKTERDTARAEHKTAVKDRAAQVDALLGPLATAPGQSWTWALERADDSALQVQAAIEGQADAG